MEKVKKISRYALPIIFIASIVVLLFINQSKNQFKEEVENKAKRLEVLEQQSQLYHQKSKADELFIAGEYDEAMEIYEEIEDAIDDKSFMQNRKATIARFKSLRTELDSTQNMSSSQLADMESQMDERVREVEEKYISQLIEVKKDFEKKINTLNNAISQKNLEIQNKAELGRLTFYNANGTKIAYFGEVKFGKANGDGVGHYSSNSVYDGEWKNNMKHGKGTYKWADGHRYVGQYVNDKREGQGSYYWNTGEQYEGQWKNDKRNGEGTLYDKDGNVKLKGDWNDDEIVQ